MVKKAYLLTLSEYTEQVVPILQEIKSFLKKNPYFILSGASILSYPEVLEAVENKIDTGLVHGNFNPDKEYYAFKYKRAGETDADIKERAIEEFWQYNSTHQPNIIKDIPPEILTKKKELFARAAQYFENDRYYHALNPDLQKTNKPLVRLALDRYYEKMLKEGEITIEEVEKVAASVDVKVPKRLYDPSILKVDENKKKLQEAIAQLPAVNQQIMIELGDKIETILLPYCEEIFIIEKTRYLSTIKLYAEKNEAFLLTLIEKLPFYPKIFTVAERILKQSGTDKYGYPIKNDYLIGFTRKPDWEAQLDREIRLSIEGLKVQLKVSIYEHFYKVTLPITNIHPHSIRTGAKGFEATLIFHFNNGSRFTFYTEAIAAGGYNIQCFHFRYITQFISATLADGSVLHSLTTSQIWQHFSDSKLAERENIYYKVEDAKTFQDIINAVYNFLKSRYEFSNVRRNFGTKEMSVSWTIQEGHIKKSPALYLNPSLLTLEQAKEKTVKMLDFYKFDKPPTSTNEPTGSGISKRFQEGGNLKKSNLTPEQQALVRTPEFKAWFGDWENDPANSSKIVDENGEPMVVWHGTTSKEEFNIFRQSYNFEFIYFAKNKMYSWFHFTKNHIDHPHQLRPFFLNIRNLLNAEEFGFEVVKYPELRNFFEGITDLDNSDMKNYNRRFWEVIRYSQNIYFDLKEKSVYDGISFYENINDTTIWSDTDNWTVAYVVLDKNQMKLADGSNTTFDASNPDIRFEQGGSVSDQNNGDIDDWGNEIDDTPKSNLTPYQQKIVRTPEFKAWFGDWDNDRKNASRILDKYLEPQVLYHQTSSDSFGRILITHGFDISEDTARARKGDFEMPNGIFLKPSDADIGIAPDSVQIPLFANIRNPLVFDDRYHIARYFKGYPEYDDIAIDIKDVDYTYSKKMDDWEKSELAKFVEDLSDPEENNNRYREHYGKMLDGHQPILDEWKIKYNEITKRGRDFITKTLIDEGYDGMIVLEDQGSWGRKTKTYIALYPTQVKLADGNNTAFNPENTDIRYEKGGNTQAQAEACASSGTTTNFEPQTKNFFSTETTGSSYYDGVMADRYGYHFFYKRLKAHINWIKPERYLEIVRDTFKLHPDTDSLYIVDDKKAVIRLAIENGSVIDMPYLSYVSGFGQEGRNRAAVAMEMGIEKIPVLIVENVTEQEIADRVIILTAKATEVLGENATPDEIIDYLRVTENVHHDGLRIIDAYLNGYAEGGGITNKRIKAQQALISSDAFKKWFDGSLIKKNNTPLVVYHGSQHHFNTFSKDHAGTSHTHAAGHMGFYFTENFELACRFTQKFSDPIDKGKLSKCRIYPVFLRMCKPYYMYYYEFINTAALPLDELDTFKKSLITKGYDGVIIEKATSTDPDLKEFKYRQYVVFEPNQIKLADGSNTSFELLNDDMRFEQGGTTTNREANERSEVHEPRTENQFMQGGIAEGKSIKEIAEKWHVSQYSVVMAIREGMKIEAEHTSDTRLQWDISKDHIWEMGLDYYPELKLMESKIEINNTKKETERLKRQKNNSKRKLKKL